MTRFRLLSWLSRISSHEATPILTAAHLLVNLRRAGKLGSRGGMQTPCPGSSSSTADLTERTLKDKYTSWSWHSRNSKLYLTSNLNPSCFNPTISSFLGLNQSWRRNKAPCVNRFEEKAHAGPVTLYQIKYGWPCITTKDGGVQNRFPPQLPGKNISDWVLSRGIHIPK